MLYILFYKQDSYAESYLWSETRKKWSASAILRNWKINKLVKSGADYLYGCSEDPNFCYFKIDIPQYSIDTVIYIGHGLERGYGPRPFVGSIKRQTEVGKREEMRRNGAKRFARTVLSLCTPHAILMMTCHARKWIEDEKEVLVNEGMPRIPICATDNEFSNMMMQVLITPFLSVNCTGSDYVHL